MNGQEDSGKDSKAATTGVHLWLVLWKTSRALEGHARRSIEALGMCLSDFGILEALVHKGPLPVSALGQKMLLTSGSITTAVDRLERRGFVERRGDANDRRARIVHLTHAGHKLIRKLFAEHERDMERAVSGLARHERTTLIGMLHRLGRSAEALLAEQELSALEESTRGRRKQRRRT